MIEPPYYPIIYLRGFALTEGVIDDTVSSPYMGFNQGSTRIRQTSTGAVIPHVFESPLIRLMKEHGYVDAYRGGQLVPQGPVPSRSLWIFRYYDIADQHFGEGERKEIEVYANQLREFILHVRDAVLEKKENPGIFRVYLVAASMGGLICRCYLQHASIPDLAGGTSQDSQSWRRKGVDKLFTYGTPHGGIEFAGVRIPDLLDWHHFGNFSERRMRECLDLDDNEPLNSLNGRYPEERVFCLVGTNWRDYQVAAGWVRRLVGEMSDGLVLIKNASVRGAARAFVHRSHTGHFGLVNSESGYQNLRRFLFGDTRVLVQMTGVKVSLPPQLAEAERSGKSIRDSYHIDTVFSVRGVPVELSRRRYDEESAIFRSREQLTQGPTTLFTTFLTRSARVKPRRRSLGFAVSLQVRVPRYEVDRLLFDDYYEGGILFADKLNVEVTPQADGSSRVRYGWDSVTPDRTSHRLEFESADGAVIGTIPFGRSTRRPGIWGRILLTITRWNSEHPVS